MSRKRRKKPQEDGGNSMEWLMTFSDVLTLLITFFVLLISMSSMDDKKLKETMGFFNGAFGNLEGAKTRFGETPESQIGVFRALPWVRKRAKPKKERDSRVKTALALAEIEGMAGDLARRLSGNDAGVGKHPLDSDAVELMTQQPVRISQTDKKIEVDLLIGLLFTRGAVSLRPESGKLVERLATLIGARRLERIDVPRRENGDVAELYSPWTLAIWRAGSLSRRVTGARTVAASAVARGQHLRIVLAKRAGQQNKQTKPTKTPL